MTERRVWRERGPAWRIGVVLVVVALLVAGLVVAALLTDVEGELRGGRDASASGAPPPSPGLIAAGDDAPVPDPAALDRIMGPLASSPAVGDLTASVVDDATGQVLWERRPRDAKVPASTVKLLTAVAALSRLPADARVDTVLARGTQPDTLVVVPGGDPTMSGAADPGPLFPGAATIAQAAGVVRTAGQTPARIVVAPGPYTGSRLGPGWSPVDIAAGNIAPVQAWMLDAGRLDPADEYSPRTSEPTLAAGRALARELGIDPAEVRVSEEPVETTEEFGRVSSAPLTERVRSMLVHSDNVLAETICREVALDRDPDQKAGFGEGSAAVVETLSERGLDMSGVRLDDCSGMSAGNRLSSAALTDVLRTAAAPDATRELRDLLDALPVAAGSGTLADRFDGPSAAGAGWVRAKTGTLRETSALAGTVTSADGRTMSFALLASGTDPAVARPVLDRIAAELRSCGCR
ncbi:D-alanyl-D-alanine carboxypeptidase/D-alanyl-D-alanine endopeptidase [Dietzia psychralcaliphila]|uniref:D-alanyl-D-alanine carboxypeptidase n=1 Tax=Dietzia psychralcaliphila TaxID=139021 RepID=A0AAD0JPE3_9ACTN|nr:D-alanyl-D-alanine carboxypeptidase/D-alanyl-D-alanine-endopeptidase [Dietzia psychralcaliphila]AWH94584.1 D-alanyl-D-alanine carboxypeptidase [Dietzia psychralcaliphila]PTM86132.1 D-alanyl-D-alanine carboxypeptidase/D-alanyl-D-alanine-endopeptidase (penicillin-binding protein 4) [Dietzia psychralcaliphila]